MSGDYDVLCDSKEKNVLRVQNLIKLKEEIKLSEKLRIKKMKIRHVTHSITDFISYKLPVFFKVLT